MDTLNLADFLKGKKLVIIAGIFTVLIIVLMIFSTRPKTQSNSTIQPTQEVQPVPESGIFNSSQDEQSPEVQQAIAEQMQADQEYGDWQANNSNNYPWLRKLPLTSEKYFVYFDLNKKVFIGRLYPKTGDNLDNMKSDILKILTVDEEIPMNNFKVEWVVNP